MRWTTLTTKTKATVVVSVAALLWIGGAGTAGAVVASVVNAPSTARQIVDTASDAPSPPPTRSSTPTPTPTPVVVVSEVQETTPLPFESTTIDDPTLAKGATRIATVGVPGVTTTTYRVTTTDGVETARDVVRTETTTAAVAQVTAVGSYVAPAPAAAPAVQPAPVAAPPAAAPAAQPTTIVPGAFCPDAQVGAVQQAANGRSYQCGGKGADANGHFHWNTM